MHVSAQTYATGLTVVLPLDEALIADWEKADALGSARAAYAHGLALFQRNQFADALPFLRRADERGHAEAALLVAQLLAADGDEQGARDAVQRADRRQSIWAPLALATTALEAGDTDEVARLRGVLAERARAADAVGAADGTYLRAAMAVSDGDMEDGLRLARRADQRGSTYAAYVRAQLAAQQGLLAEATEAAQRCASWGMAAPMLLLGDLRYRRRQFFRARGAWRAARYLADQQGDQSVSAAAAARLHPGPFRQVLTRPVLTAVVILAAVATTLMGQAPWLLAAAGWVAVAFSTTLGRRIGDRIAVSDDTDQLGTMASMSTGVLTVAGALVSRDIDPLNLNRQIAPPTRATTSRDRLYLRMLPAVLSVLAAALTAWAVGFIGRDVMLRAFFGFLALYGLWQAAWRAPDVLDQAEPDDGGPPPEAIYIMVRIGLSTFVNWNFRFAVTEPRIAGIVGAIRETSVADCPVGRGWRRLSPWLTLLGMLLTAGSFAAEAVAPHRVELAALLVTILTTAVLGAAAVRGLEQLLHGLLVRAWGSVITGAGFLTLVALLALAAHWIGLLKL